MSSVFIPYLDLKQLAEDRLNDAKALYHGGQFDGATYMSGYAIEMALKARICKITCCPEWPPIPKLEKEFFTHHLDDLVRLGGLESIKNSNPMLLADWSIVTGWSPDMRYQRLGVTQQDTQTLLIALINVFKWIKKNW